MNTKAKKRKEINISGMDLYKLHQQYPGLSDDRLLEIAISSKKNERECEKESNSENNITPQQKTPKVTLVNSNGLLKECDIGFSWRVFFFADFIALFRGDLKWFIILGIWFIQFYFGILLGLIGLCIYFYFSATYNTVYIKELIDKGYKPYKSKDREILKKYGIVFAK